jgi:hypothetical protein
VKNPKATISFRSEVETEVYLEIIQPYELPRTKSPKKVGNRYTIEEIAEFLSRGKARITPKYVILDRKNLPFLVIAKVVLSIVTNEEFNDFDVVDDEVQEALDEIQFAINGYRQDFDRGKREIRELKKYHLASEEQQELKKLEKQLKEKVGKLCQN